MATAEVSAKANAARATAQFSNAIGQTSADATTADTDVGTSLTDFDTAAANVIAITGDTYSNTTHQYTFGGATGLTHAQWATFGALLNTAQAAVVAAKAATAQVVADAAAIDSGADVTVRLSSTANVPSMDVLRDCLRKIEQVFFGSKVVTRGSNTPRVIPVEFT